jgi:hypothetical protein
VVRAVSDRWWDPKLAAGELHLPLAALGVALQRAAGAAAANSLTRRRVRPYNC